MLSMLPDENQLLRASKRLGPADAKQRDGKGGEEYMAKWRNGKRPESDMT